MRQDKNIAEKIVNGIGIILWFLIWKPISIIFKYLYKLLSETMAGIHKNLVKFFSFVGFMILVSLIAYIFNISK